MAIGDVPAITWGAAFVNTWSIAYPVDFANHGSEPRKGSERAVGPAGGEDAWIVGTEEILEGVIIAIPIADLTPDNNGNNATGWDGATGVKAALEFLLDAGVGRFIPDHFDITTSPPASSNGYVDAVCDDGAPSSATVYMDQKLRFRQSNPPQLNAMARSVAGLHTWNYQNECNRFTNNSLGPLIWEDPGSSVGDPNASPKELASAKGVDLSYAGRLLKLRSAVPKLRREIPLVWDEQHQLWHEKPQRRDN